MCNIQLLSHKGRIKKKINGIFRKAPDPPTHPPPSTEKIKKMKYDLHAMKRILYDTGNLRGFR